MDKNSTEAAVSAQNMQSNSSCNNSNSNGAGSIKEAVCIDAQRVYDSCSSQESAGWKRKQNSARIPPDAVLCFI